MLQIAHRPVWTQGDFEMSCAGSDVADGILTSGAGASGDAGAGGDPDDRSQPVMSTQMQSAQYLNIM